MLSGVAGCGSLDQQAGSRVAGGEDREGVVVARRGQQRADDLDLRAGQQRIAVAGRLEQEHPVAPLPAPGVPGSIGPITQHQVAGACRARRVEKRAVLAGLPRVGRVGQLQHHVAGRA